MVKSGQSCAEAFVTVSDEGALIAATGTPVGALYVNGIANAAAVTVTGTNPYKWAVTLPALSAGDIVEMYITATVVGVSVAALVWDEVVDTVRTSEVAAAAAAAVWAYATRTLTSSAAATIAAVMGSTLNVTRGVTYAATLSGLTIPATWTKIYLTVKNDDGDADSASVLQIVESNPAAPATDGALYVEGAAAGAQRTNGELVVTQAAGTVAINLADDLTVVLTRRAGLVYDLKCLKGDGSSVLLSGEATLNVLNTPTRTI